MNIFTKRKKGLSLIQVLGVIILIGILVSITVATLVDVPDKVELSTKQIQAENLAGNVSKYAVENGEVPTVIPNADYIAKPALIDVSKVAPGEEKEFSGNFFIYGPQNKVTYDYPVEYIAQQFNKYEKEKGRKPLIEDTSVIDVETLYTEGYLDYPPQTSYVLLSENGTVAQVPSEQVVESNRHVEDGSAKPVKPTIIPNRAAPYYENQEITFTAKSYYKKGDVTFEWSGLKPNNLYPANGSPYTITVVAVGSDGVRSEPSTFILIVNEKNEKPSKPVITMTPNTDITSDKAIKFTATATDPEGDGITYHWSGEKLNGQKGSTVTAKLPRGQHTVSVYAIDENGNYSDRASITFEVKNGKPEIIDILQSPKPAYNDSIVDFEPVVRDPDGDMIEYSIEGLSETKIYPIGTHKITFKAKDFYGAESEPFVYDLVIHNRKPTPPTLTMNPSPAADIRSNTKITFNVGDSTDPDGHRVVNYEFENKKDYYPVGTHTVKARAIDELGLASDWTTITFRVNNTVPTQPTISMNPSTNLYANTNINWSASGSTDIDGDSITYEWVNKNSKYPKGTHTVKVRAKDSRGDYSTYATKTFTVQNSAPVITSFSTNKSTYKPGETITYNVSHSDIDGDAVTYEYQNKMDKAQTPGTHTIKVRAKDSDGAYSDWKSLQITITNKAPSKPTISISHNSSNGKVYSTTKIYVSASGSVDPEGHSFTYKWTKTQPLNGGTLAPGVYEFEVYAEDQYGAKSDRAVRVLQVISPNDSGGGGLVLTGPHSKIYYPANGNLPSGATFVKFNFEVPYVDGHCGSDYAYVKGLDRIDGSWDQLAYTDSENGAKFENNKIYRGQPCSNYWQSYHDTYSNPTPGKYIRLEYYYYTNHNCMYNKSNITYGMEYEYGAY